MFADVVGYSRMMASNEERTLELLKDFENICTPIIANNSGQIIKKAGDELFCEFSSAKQAVDCALAIQEAIQPYNDSRPKDFKLQVRIGIHVGDIVLRDGDVFGDGVNVASRIQPFSSPGGICVSNTVRDALSSHPNYDIESEGKQELKNIIEKHTLYSIKTGFEDKTIIKKYKKSKKTVPALLGIVAVCIAGILFFGDSLNIWQISNSSTNEKLPKVHLLYIGSPKNDHGSCYEYAENTLSENKDSELFSLNKEELHSLRKNIESRLYSEFYNHNLEIRVIKDNEEIDYIDNTINEDNNDKITAKKVYDFFNKPAHIVFTWVYSINSSQGTTLEYVADVFGGLGDGFINSLRGGGTTETIKEIEEGIFNGLVQHITAKENLSAKGKVLKVDGDYIYINTGGLKLIENMNLIGYTEWSHNDKDDDGFTDRDSSYYKWLNDIKRALEYVKNSNNYSSEDINYYQKKYNWLISDSLRSTAKGERWPGQFGYNLKVVSIKDSVAIAKLIEKAHPWVEVNIGDGVMLAY